MSGNINTQKRKQRPLNILKKKIKNYKSESIPIEPVFNNSKEEPKYG